MGQVKAELRLRMKKQGRVSVAEAAKRAMVSGATIRGWIAGSHLDAVLYAHSWWVTEESLTRVTAVLKGAV